jgi:hypothetical protein
LVARIESSKVLRRPNWFARCSVALGLVTLAVGPAAWEVWRRRSEVTLIQVAGAIAASGLLALLTLLLARRGRLHIEHTLGRAGGETTVRIGRGLGLLGLCLSLTACVALAFYAVLRVFYS